MKKWDNRFMGLSKLVATWSKDKGTGVGAVIVNDDKKVLSLGFNGFPRGVNDNIVKRHESPVKFHYTAHAESNAINEAETSLREGTLYCTFFPCSDCARSIIQKGIKRVVAPEPDFSDKRWGEGHSISLEMFEEVGIEVSFYEEEESKLMVFWEIGCGGGKVYNVITEDRFFNYVEYYKKKLEKQGFEIVKYEVNGEVDVVEFFVENEKSKYIYFGKYELNDFIFKKEVQQKQKETIFYYLRIRAMSKKPRKNIEIKNRKASHNYEFLETEVAGIRLVGSEIKSIREGDVSIGESHCYINDNKMFITGMHIAEFKQAGGYGHEPYRLRELLLTKKQIRKFEKELKIKGRTMVPVKLYINNDGLAKLLIALAKGKKKHDKRQDIKDKDIKRETDRELKG